MSKGIGLTMEEVSEKCWSFEAPAYMAVSFFLCLSPNFFFLSITESNFSFAAFVHMEGSMSTWGRKVSVGTSTLIIRTKFYLLR